MAPHRHGDLLHADRVRVFTASGQRSEFGPASLAVAFRATLEANGWRHLSSTTAAEKGTTQVYETAASSPQVRLYEGWYYTWGEVAGRLPAPGR